MFAKLEVRPALGTSKGTHNLYTLALQASHRQRATFIVGLNLHRRSSEILSLLVHHSRCQATCIPTQVPHASTETFHASGEVVYLTHGDMTWQIAGVTVVDPTREQLSLLATADFLRITPRCSKTDLPHSPGAALLAIVPPQPAPPVKTKLMVRLRGGAVTTRPCSLDLDLILHIADLLVEGDQEPQSAISLLSTCQAYRVGLKTLKVAFLDVSITAYFDGSCQDCIPTIGLRHTGEQLPCYSMDLVWSIGPTRSDPSLHSIATDVYRWNAGRSLSGRAFLGGHAFRQPCKWTVEYQNTCYFGPIGHTREALLGIVLRSTDLLSRRHLGIRVVKDGRSLQQGIATPPCWGRVLVNLSDHQALLKTMDDPRPSHNVQLVNLRVVVIYGWGTHSANVVFRATVSAGRNKRSLSCPRDNNDFIEGVVVSGRSLDSVEVLTSFATPTLEDAGALPEAVIMDRDGYELDPSTPGHPPLQPPPPTPEMTHDQPEQVAPWSSILPWAASSSLGQPPSHPPPPTPPSSPPPVYVPAPPPPSPLEPPPPSPPPSPPNTPEQDEVNDDEELARALRDSVESERKQQVLQKLADDEVERALQESLKPEDGLAQAIQQSIKAEREQRACQEAEDDEVSKVLQDSMASELRRQEAADDEISKALQDSMASELRRQELRRLADDEDAAGIDWVLRASVTFETGRASEGSTSTACKIGEAVVEPTEAMLIVRKQEEELAEMLRLRAEDPQLWVAIELSATDRVMTTAEQELMQMEAAIRESVRPEYFWEAESTLFDYTCFACGDLVLQYGDEPGSSAEHAMLAPTPRPHRQRSLTPEESARGKRCRNCSEGDGPLGGVMTVTTVVDQVLMTFRHGAYRGLSAELQMALLFGAYRHAHTPSVEDEVCTTVARVHGVQLRTSKCAAMKAIMSTLASRHPFLPELPRGTTSLSKVASSGHAYGEWAARLGDIAYMQAAIGLLMLSDPAVKRTIVSEVDKATQDHAPFRMLIAAHGSVSARAPKQPRLCGTFGCTLTDRHPGLHQVDEPERKRERRGQARAPPCKRRTLSTTERFLGKGRRNCVDGDGAMVRAGGQPERDEGGGGCVSFADRQASHGGIPTSHQGGRKYAAFTDDLNLPQVHGGCISSARQDASSEDLSTPPQGRRERAALTDDLNLPASPGNSLELQSADSKGSERANSNDRWRRLRKLIAARQVTLRKHPPHQTPAPEPPPPSHGRCWERSHEAQLEFDSFDWPIRTLVDLKRLLACHHIMPTWLMLGDFTMTMTAAVEAHRGVTALMVDRREPEGKGLTYCGEFHDVLPLAFWDALWAWPSCTHLAMADEYCRDNKAYDGRMFYGCLAVLYVYAAGAARAVFVEQPNVWLFAFIEIHHVHLLPQWYGDEMTKTFNILSRGMSFPAGDLTIKGDWSRRKRSSFADGDEADRWRSSWQHYPKFVASLAAGVRLDGVCNQLDYPALAWRFACAWHDEGLPVPAGWFTPSGNPPDSSACAYQMVRGVGDGRRAKTVDPRLEGVPQPALPPSTELFKQMPAMPLIQKMVDVRELVSGGLVLVMLAIDTQPMIYAALDGFHVLGAQLPAAWARTPAPMKLAQAWATALCGEAIASCVFFAGTYTNGPRIAVVPVRASWHADAPKPPLQVGDMVYTNAQRLFLVALGVGMAWCTLGALASTPYADVASHAVAATLAFIRPVEMLADDARLEVTSSFTIGGLAATPLISVPVLSMTTMPSKAGLESDSWAIKLIINSLSAAVGTHAAWLHELIYQVKLPPYADVPSEIMAALPTFDASELLVYPLTEPYRPPDTPPLAKRPPQLPCVDCCPRSVRDILYPGCMRRAEDWLRRNEEHMQCMITTGSECSDLRPRPAAFGQSCVLPPFRGRIWDFTRERSACGVPLDFHLPADTHLNLTTLAAELRDYPDRRLVSLLLEGVRFEADVELQAVFNPHLFSLVNGYHAVDRELHRLEEKGWYKFFEDIPFWPIYINGQGSTPRKYEAGRDRRTTEGGGPRNPTFDETGLQAWAINDAASSFHMPEYYKHDPRLLAWATESRQPYTFDAAGRPRKMPKERKPTLRDVAADLAVLRAAGKAMGMPVYLFGDDAADHFNQLFCSSEEWWLLGVTFVTPSELVRMFTNDFRASPGGIFFISERRLGFGMTPSSNIAQRFSEALLDIFRRRMDAAEDETPATSAELSWRQGREELAVRLAASGGRPYAEVLREQQRLYFVHCYTDDPAFGVLGVERALRLLKTWRQLTLDVNLIMAVAAKRSFGVHMLWLGVLIFAGLGCLVTPKDKLLRTVQGLNSALAARMDFSEYRSLIGMLEHLRTVACLPRWFMHYLYEPHANTIVASNPNATVAVSHHMRTALLRWQQQLHRAAGASVLAVLDKSKLTHLSSGMAPLTFVASADAATDSNPPGLAGFCHGLYWYLPLHPEWTEWLHITVLELLATGFNAIIMGPYAEGAQLVLQSDALATPYVLVHSRERSPTLRAAHHELLGDPQFVAVATHAHVCHLSGDCNALSDAASRGEWQRLSTLAQLLRIKLTRLPVPPRLILILHRVLEGARRSGVRVRRGTYDRSGPALPRLLLDPSVAPAREPAPLIQPPVMRARHLTRLERSLDAGQSCNERRDAVIHLAVEGGIGAGKSTCLAELADHFLDNPSVKVIQEPVASWRDSGILERFYEGTVTPLEFQLVALATLTAPIIAALNDPRLELVITERSPLSNLAVFATVNLRGDSLVAFELAYDALAAALPPCTRVTAYLDATPALTQQRARERGRHEEAAIPLSLHHKLYSRHETMFNAIGHRKLRIDATASAGDVADAMLDFIDTFWWETCVSPCACPYAAARHMLCCNIHSTGPDGLTCLCRERAGRRCNCPCPACNPVLTRAEAAMVIQAMARSRMRSHAMAVKRWAFSRLLLARQRALSALELFLAAGQSCNEQRDAVDDEWTSNLLARLRENRRLSRSQTAPYPAVQCDVPSVTPRRAPLPPVPVPPVRYSESPPVAMPVVDIGPLQLPCPAQRPAGVAAPTSLLHSAGRAQAASRAAALAASPFGASIDVELLANLISHADDVAEYGTAYGTLKKDELVWRRWSSFADLTGFDANVSAATAREQPDALGTLLAVFMLHVYPLLRGRGCDSAKPRSAFAYVLGVIRIFGRWKVTFPSAKAVRAELHGLLRTFVSVHGKHALQPRRREPFLFTMLRTVCALPDIFQSSGRPYASDVCNAFKRMLCIAWYTGHRLAEFVFHASGEIVYLTRGDVTWEIAGVIVVDPTREQLSLLTTADFPRIAPCRSKTDQFGDIHSPFPSVAPFQPGLPHSPGAALLAIELEHPCRGAARSTTPLFADSLGRPFTHGLMDSILHHALVQCYGLAIASVHSWHSMRSGLATALRAAGCPDEIIMLLCRWMNPDSLRAYARVGPSGFISWLSAAEKAVVDARQTSNLMRLDNAAGMIAIHGEFGHRVGPRAQAVLDAQDGANPDAHAHTQETPAAAQPPPPTTPPILALTAATCVGRRVRVPRYLWRSALCTELDGTGWEGRILSYDPPFTTVQFLHATTPGGVPYEPLSLELRVLEALE